MSSPRLFRLHLRPDGGSADMRTSFNYCLANGIFGVGWRVGGLRNSCTWDEFESGARKTYGMMPDACLRIRDLQPSDLVWTRSPFGEYYLARVITGWEYFIGHEAHEEDIDVANVFRCSWQKIPLDAVPGKVVACFRARRCFQAVNSASALELSKHLWNRHTKTEHYLVDRSRFQGDLFTALDDKESEDLIFIYLQEQGWRVVPSSRQSDTMAYEFTLVHPKTNQVAAVQVKTGDAAIDRGAYASADCRVFLFQPNERYYGTASPNVTELSRHDVLSFFRESFAWLPENLRAKAELCSFR